MVLAMNETATQTPDATSLIVASAAPVIPKPEREIAYVINDKYFKGFEVVKSANAWWIEKSKVEDLIKCFKNGYNIKQSCIYVGITKEQWVYFNEIHPNFSYVRECCEEVGKMLAETNIHGFLLEKDKETTRWFAERRIPEKYGKNLADGLPAGTIVNQNFGTIINSPAQNVPQSVLDRLKNKGQ